MKLVFKVNNKRVTLTERQTEVVNYIVEGYPNFEIARLMKVHPKSITQHLHDIVLRLGISEKYSYRIRLIYLVLRSKGVINAETHKLIRNIGDNFVGVPSSDSDRPATYRVKSGKYARHYRTRVK